MSLIVSGFEHGSGPTVRVFYGWFDVALKKCTYYCFKTVLHYVASNKIT